MRGAIRFAAATLGRILVVGLPIATSAACGQSSGEGAHSQSPVSADNLYVGEDTTNIDVAEATAGQNLRPFVVPSDGGAPKLEGPRGLLVLGTTLIVSNQNAKPIAGNGEIDEYSTVDGHFLRTVVHPTDTGAPFAPRGIILDQNHATLYVADFGVRKHGQPGIGRVASFAYPGGGFNADLDFSSVIESNATGSEFHPRGLVFGPDGNTLYVSLFSEVDFPKGGWIVSYDFKDNHAQVVASFTDAGCSQYLNAPEGLVFGPDGLLYTVGRGLADQTDKILVFDPQTGACMDYIDLETDLTQGRAYAQSLVFGPNRSLYLPMRFSPAPGDRVKFNFPGPDIGAIRAYDVSPCEDAGGDCRRAVRSEFIPAPPANDAGVAPPSLWYLVFGRTDPTTLAYPE
jgi:hypothetical protein